MGLCLSMPWTLLLALALLAPSRRLGVEASSEPETAPVFDAPVARAEVRTCQACALFSLPELKRFLVTQRDRYVDQYTGVAVVYERGLAPQLTAYARDGRELGRVDLKRHATVDAMRALLAGMGFRPRAVFEEEACADQHEDCQWWARHGRCDTRFVAERCAKSCRTCAKDEL